MPKSLTSRLNQNQTVYMQQINLHQQKLIAIIIAVVGLIALILPWQSVSIDLGGFGMGGTRGNSVNGFRGWGILSLLGILTVVVASVLGDKTKPYDAMFKNIAMGGFGAIVVGAIIYFIRIQQVGGGGYAGVKSTAGFGLWISIVVGLAGLAWVAGLIKLNPSSGHSTPSAPPPPPPKA